MKQRRPVKHSAWLHIAVPAGAGLLSAFIVLFTIGWKYAPLAGWDIAALVFLGWMLAILHSTTPKQTAELASIEDPGRAVSDIVFLTASIMSLAAVAILLFQVRSEGKVDNMQKIIPLSLSLISVILSWTIVHTVYTLKYARTYYGGETGIDFNCQEPPSYGDFAYLAFTIGMTYQVSDTSLTSREFRRLALYQALLSYLFGVVIIGATINFIVSLGG